MPLELGTYQTRNGRVVKLHSVQRVAVTLLNGTKTELDYFTGTMFKSDTVTPESDYEWCATQVPNTIGEFVRPHNRLPAGQGTLMDLVVKVG